MLPEVWTGLGFSDPNMHREIAEEIPGPVTDRLCEKAHEHGMAVCGSLYERDGNAVHNTAPVISQAGEIVGRYRKTHLFDVPNRTDIRSGVQESDRIAAGDELPVFDLQFARVGVSICSDLRFPEVYRELALDRLRGSACASRHSWPPGSITGNFCCARAPARTRLMSSPRARSAPSPNPALVSSGARWWWIPWAPIVATASDTETVMTTVIDLDYIAEVRRRWPLLEQRGPTLYQTIAKS